MRKSILYSLIIVLFSSLNLFAQDFSGVKLGIDPGHGGHTSNDRFIPETGFWESDGNWDKANHLKEMLESMGAEVILTRDGNSNSDDPSLSERVAIGNNNNVDFFHSIHSNAFNGEANYTVLLYNGTSNNPATPEAKDMGGIMTTKIHEANRTTNDYNRASQDFLGFNLGVLRNLNMPGTLSEGSFHDYIPESYRLLNTSYRRHEAWAIVRSFVEFYDMEPLSHGIIAGIVRDKIETVDYHYISGTGDRKQPINNIKVTLMPDSLVYHGDENNNGFYMFDSLAPGEYQVIFEAEDYYTDTATVTVEPNKTVFANKQMVLNPVYDPPQVVSTEPGNNSEEVSLRSDIVVNFDLLMNMEATEQAFSITPNIDGSFDWKDNQKKMIFDPNGLLEPGTQYTVTLASTSKSYFDVTMAEDYSFSFGTRADMNLQYVYPEDGDSSVSTTVKIRAQFDAPIKSSSLAGNVFFQDTSGNNVPINVDMTAYSKGRISFEPETPLEYNTPYRIILNEGISDIENLTFGENKEIRFTTFDNDFFEGQTVEEFDNIGGWWDPNQSGSTVGTDADNTTFTISGDRKYSSNYSGKLEYLFTDDSGGVVRVYNSNKPSVGSDEDAKFGMWIFGDLSYNVLEYWFYYDNSTNAMVVVDTVDWTGWKQKVINVGDIPGSGERLFHSMVVKQSSEGLTSGEIYFDAVQSGVPTSVEKDKDVMPAEYALEQNYPNPFNPSTQIAFTIPEASNVTLEIYNMLGEKVSTLVDSRRLSAGRYEYTWNGKDNFGGRLSSGVYLYRIQAGEFVQIKKMMMLK